jgi:3-oxoadipate enol-lactonase
VNPHDGDRAGTTDTTIVANGISHRVRIDGDSGPWVVFSNSLGTTLEMWDAQVLALPGHRVLRYDTRGHGGTAAPPGPYTLEELADDLIGILDGVGVDECAFVGLSLGGMIGQVAMLKAPHRFRCAVLADTTSRYGPEAAERFNTRIETALHSGLGPIADTIPASWFTADFPSRKPDTVARFQAMLAGNDPEGYAGCCAAIPAIDVTDRLAELSFPVRVIVGQQDHSTTVEHARRIVEHLPDADLVIIPHAAHLSNVEQPDVFNDALVSFVEKTMPSTQ